MRCERKQSGNELDGMQKRSFYFRGNSASCRWGNLRPNIKHSRDTGIAAVGIAVVGIAAVGIAVVGIAACTPVCLPS